MRRRLAGLIAILCLAGAAWGQVQIDREADTAALVRDGAVVWRFHYGQGLTKPYFHPVALADGTVLTWERPADHVWHYGLWFSWKYINGVNYWEESNGRAAGVTDWDAGQVKIETRPDGAARIEMELSYHEPNEPAVLAERRTVAISAVDEAGSYTLDWTSVFTAVAEKVELTRTPIPGEPDSRPWGGYAGLSFRGRKGIEEVRFITTQGPAELTNGGWRGRDEAIEYSGLVEGREFGMAVLDHPGNLNFPTPWYLTHDAVTDYWGPAVLYHGGHEMAGGDSFTLRYRVIVHEGRWDAGELARRFGGFAEEKRE